MPVVRDNKCVINQKKLLAAILLVGFQLSLVFSAAPGFASDTAPGLAPYFGKIPVFSEPQISELRSFLRSLDGSDCQRFGVECSSLDNFFNKFMGDIRNPENPKLLIYIDENLEIRTNMIIWKNRVTPYLFDAQNIWVTVLAEKDIELEAILATLYKAFTFGRFSQKAFMPAEVTKKDRETRGIAKPIRLSKLGQEKIGNNLWLGIERFYLEPQTSIRISVLPGKTHSNIKKKTVTVHETGKVTVETEDKLGASPSAREKQETEQEPGFYRSEANFTNSWGSRFGLSAAIGATFDVDDAHVNDIHIDNTNFDGYLCAHLYLIRPTLTKGIEKRSYKPSISLFAGTPLDVLSEIVTGVSVGHLFGKNGISLGVNIMDPFEQDGKERQTRAFIAFDIRIW